MSDGVVVFQCCPSGECDTFGPGEEGTYPCAHCSGSGVYTDGYLSEKYAATKPGDRCPYCKGTGEGGGYSTATCSKCGQRAIDRAMWEGP